MLGCRQPNKTNKTTRIVATFIKEDWAPPRKPAVLRAALALGVLGILAVLGYAVWAQVPWRLLMFNVAAQSVQALLLYRIAAGTPGMRWVYIGFDIVQLAATFILNPHVAGRDIFFTVISIAVWTLLLLPDSHDWFARAKRRRLELWRAWAGQVPVQMRGNLENGAYLAVLCGVFFLYHAITKTGPHWIWLVYLLPLAACVVLEWNWRACWGPLAPSDRAQPK